MRLFPPYRFLFVIPKEADLWPTRDLLFLEARIK